jgi:hypothetical protein
MNQWQGRSLLVLATALMACSSSKSRNAQQLESCTIVGGVATSAPSGDAVTQCLIMNTIGAVAMHSPLDSPTKSTWIA